MKYTYKENYWNKPELIRELISFLNQIHNLDLTLWNNSGFWDKKYRPFSYFDGDTLVSNACVYSMDMMVLGRRCKVAQISAVGTLQEYRRKGLSLELNKKAIEWARSEHDFFYLFADEEAQSLYNKCGFRKVDEHAYYYPVEGMSPKSGTMKIDVQNKDHLNLIYHLAKKREPVSDMLGVLNEKLFMFWSLYFLKDNIYYIDYLDLLVLCENVDNRLTIYDIVGKKIPEFSKIYPYIANQNNKDVEFLFMIDKMNLKDCKELKLEEGNGTHLMGDFPLEGQNFILPYTCHA